MLGGQFDSKLLIAGQCIPSYHEIHVFDGHCFEYDTLLFQKFS